MIIDWYLSALSLIIAYLLTKLVLPNFRFWPRWLQPLDSLGAASLIIYFILAPTFFGFLAHAILVLAASVWGIFLTLFTALSQGDVIYHRFWFAYWRTMSLLLLINALVMIIAKAIIFYL